MSTLINYDWHYFHCYFFVHKDAYGQRSVFYNPNPLFSGTVKVCSIFLRRNCIS